MKHWLTGSLGRLICITLVAGSLFGSFPVEAQTRRDPAMFELLNRIEQLEREIRQLRGELKYSGFGRRSWNDACKRKPASIPPPIFPPNPIRHWRPNRPPLIRRPPRWLPYR
ncbi:MAG: hypothetical protein R3F37_05325 [Candidatus Competibacteraceae bacterium]